MYTLCVLLQIPHQMRLKGTLFTFEFFWVITFRVRLQGLFLFESRAALFANISIFIHDHFAAVFDEMPLQLVFIIECRPTLFTDMVLDIIMSTPHVTLEANQAICFIGTLLALEVPHLFMNALNVFCQGCL